MRIVTAFLLTVFANTASAAIYKLKAGEDLDPMLKANEYSFVSFYDPEDEKAVEFDKIIGKACNYYDKRMNNDKRSEPQWEQRMIGWFSVNLAELPNYKEVARNATSAQLMFANNQQMTRKYSQLKRTHEKEYMDRNAVAEYVKKMTGDFIQKKECIHIAEENREWAYETIYFGAKEDIERGGKFHFLQGASMMERYSFMGTNTENGYFYNDD